jgi:hypothetical protein
MGRSRPLPAEPVEDGIEPRPAEREGVTQGAEARGPLTNNPTPGRPGTRPNVDYKGAPLDAGRGPGLGCFWLQVIVLAVVIVLTPLSAAWDWPVVVTIVLLATTLVLLLLVGQTIIFLLRLVAADRRSEGRRRPMGSATRTVGEIEDESRARENGTNAGDDDGTDAREDESRVGDRETNAGKDRSGTDASVGRRATNSPADEGRVRE